MTSKTWTAGIERVRWVDYRNGLRRYFIRPTSAIGIAAEVSTRNEWMASMCERAKEEGFEVRLTVEETHFGPQLRNVSRVEQEQAS